MNIEINGNGTVEPAGGIYPEGQIVHLVGIPEQGYSVEGWYENGILLSTLSSLDLLINSEKNITLKFQLNNTINVSGGGNAIQTAIDNARNGDILVVASGTYDQEINFGGKEIVLVSTNPDDSDIVANTIIDCGQNGRGLVFENGEGMNTVVSGFTIINGNSGT